MKQMSWLASACVGPGGIRNLFGAKIQYKNSNRFKPRKILICDPSARYSSCSFTYQAKIL